MRQVWVHNFHRTGCNLDQVKFEDAHETKLYLRLLVHVAFRFRRPWNKLILDFITIVCHANQLHVMPNACYTLHNGTALNLILLSAI